MQNLARVSKKTLLQIAAFLGFKGWSVLSKDEIVRRLARTRNLPRHELSISTLKEICRDLGVIPNSRGSEQTGVDWQDCGRGSGSTDIDAPPLNKARYLLASSRAANSMAFLGFQSVGLFRTLTVCLNPLPASSKSGRPQYINVRLEESMKKSTSINIDLHGIGRILFNRNVTVPIYQRSYAWEGEHVRDLFNDVATAISEGAHEYFIGSIVTTQNEAPRAEVADGQQRLATVTILLAAIRDWFYESGDKERAETITTDLLQNPLSQGGCSVL